MPETSQRTPEHVIAAFSPEKKTEYFKEQEESAEIGDVIFEAQKLLESGVLQPDELKRLGDTLKDAATNILFLRDQLTDIKKRIKDRSYREITSPDSVKLKWELKAQQEVLTPLEQRAKVIIDNFLLTQDEKKGMSATGLTVTAVGEKAILTISHRILNQPTQENNFKYSDGGVRTLQSQDTDFNQPESIAFKMLGDVDGAIHTFRDLFNRKDKLQRMLAKVVPEVQNSETLLQAAIEAQCAQEIEAFLVDMNAMYQSESIIPKPGTKHSNPESLAAGVTWKRSEASKDAIVRKKAKKLGLKLAYIDEKQLPLTELEADQTKADITNFIGFSREMSSLLPPIPAEAVRGLEKFVDNNGEIITLASQEDIASKIMNLESDSSPMSQFKMELELQKTETAEFKRLEDEIAQTQRLIGTLTELKSDVDAEFNAYLDKSPHKAKYPPTKLAVPLPVVRSFFGLSDANEADRTEQAKLIAKKKGFSDQLESVKLANESAKKQLEKLKERKQTPLSTFIDRLADRAITLKFSQFVDSSALKPPEITLGLSKQDRDTLRSVSQEPLDTFEDRLKIQIENIAEKLSEKVQKATDLAVETLTKDFTKTQEALKQILPANFTELQMEAAIVAFIEGTLSDERIIGSIPREAQPFFYGAQEARKGKNAVGMWQPVDYLVTPEFHLSKAKLVAGLV